MSKIPIVQAKGRNILDFALGESIAECRSPKIAKAIAHCCDVVPDLLEACQTARSAIVLGNGREIDWQSIADQLDAAIAKANHA